MGLKYSSTDSSNLMQAMRNNLIIANQITDRLSSGCDHLISSLDSGELKGAAYTAGKELFTEIIIPSIKQLQAAIDDIDIELGSYQYADSIVSEYGTLDLESLEERLSNRREQLELVEQQLDYHTHFLTQAWHFLTGTQTELSEQISALKTLGTHLEIGIQELETRIDKLRWFDQEVSRYFSDSLTVLNMAIQGAVALSQVSVDSEGHYTTANVDMSWFDTLSKTEIKTIDRSDGSKQSLINQNIRDLMLSDEAATYYRKQLQKLLAGQPEKDWPLIIQNYNQTLQFDNEGNIITPISFQGSLWGAGILILKNGKCDIPYTIQANEEQHNHFIEAVGENLVQLLSGIGELIMATFSGSAGLSLGTAGGAALAFPGGGVITVPAEAGAAACLATAGTFAVAGTITIADALSKIATANAHFEISFAKNYDDWQAAKPTSRTFGEPIEGRVEGRKSKIRVDAEPDSNSIHIQTGGGKRSPVKRPIEISDITDKQSIYQVLKDLKEPAVNNLSKGQLDRLVDNIWRAFKWLKALGE